MENTNMKMVIIESEIKRLKKLTKKSNNRKNEEYLTREIERKNIIEKENPHIDADLV